LLFLLDTVKTYVGGDKRSASVEAKALTADINTQFLTKPTALTRDPTEPGAYLVIDAWNHSIRRVNPAGVLSTLAGGKQGFKNGAGLSAQFYNPTGMVVDPNTGSIYVADSGIVSALPY
jgi:hypothetical protein